VPGVPAVSEFVPPIRGAVMGRRARAAKTRARSSSGSCGSNRLLAAPEQKERVRQPRYETVRSTPEAFGAGTQRNRKMEQGNQGAEHYC